MATDVIMPALGMAQDTGVVVQWLKKPGDAIQKGEPLFEVETDKAVVEVESPASGVLGNVSASEGMSVPVGQAIAVILADGEEAPPAAGSERESQPQAPAGTAREEKTAPVVSNSASADATSGRLRPASPAARRRAAEAGIDIRSLQGTGPEGAVVTADVAGATPATAPAREPVAAAAASAQEPSRTWRLMADRTTAAWAAPHFYLTREANAARLVSWRSALATRGVNVTFTDLLVKLAALTLKNHQYLISRWNDGTLLTQSNISIGLAVAVDEGLTVPVVHRADSLRIEEIAQERERLLQRARDRHLSPQDLEGGTFTITNLGMFGVDAFTAVINGGQAAILAVGRIAERPFVQNGQLVAAPTMVLTLGCDHRAVDGARGARFLQDLVTAIEEPAVLLG